MGIFDRLRGKRQEAEEPAVLSDANAASAVSPTLDLTEQAIPQHNDAATKILGFDKQEASRLYNPYDGTSIYAQLAQNDSQIPVQPSHHHPPRPTTHPFHSTIFTIN